MWLRTARRNRSIFEEGNMNMLIEAYVFHLFGKIKYLINLRYHHVLKTHWLGGKHNQCVDHLIHTLMNEFLLSFQNKHK
jgi:hypothetical protein